MNQTTTLTDDKIFIFVCQKDLLPQVDGFVMPNKRILQIKKCKSQKVVQQKTLSWQMLWVCLNQLGIDAANTKFFVNANGKWGCKECCFSLSHSQDMFAVAISKKDVGVDIEAVTPRFDFDLAQKILTPQQKILYFNVNPTQKQGFLAQMWTQKESIFKLSGGRAFVPSKIETENVFVKTKAITTNDNNFALSVASNNTLCPLFKRVDMTDLTSEDILF